MAREVITDEPTTTSGQQPFPWLGPGRRSLGLGRSWLFHELAAIAAWARERELWLLLLLGVTFWSLAYQVPYTHHFEFGGNKLTQRRLDDEPYLNIAEYGWNLDPEPADPAEPDKNWFDADQPSPYRWTFEHAKLYIPGIGGGPWRVSILAAGQPTAWPTTSVWSDGVLTSTVMLTVEPRIYQHLFYARNGDLTLSFDTPPYSTPTDSRPLGFVALNATVRQPDGLRLPALNQLGMLALSLGVIYGIARRLGSARRTTLVLGVALSLLLAIALARWRLPLTIFTPQLTRLALGCYILTLALLRLPVADRGPWAMEHEQGHRPGVRVSDLGRQWSPVVALVVFAFAVRLGGMQHPHIIFSDIGLNVNNLILFSQGEVYQTEGLPEEAGGGDQPYPPGLYVALAPLQLLLPNERPALEFALKLGVALYDSLIVGLIWYVLWRRGFGQRAALLGAALYVLPPPVLKSFSVGEFANLFGQALAIPLLVVLALAGARLRERRVFWAVFALLLLALLGHSGVTISLVLLLGYLGLVWLTGPRTWRLVLPLLKVGALTAVVVGVFYHSAFLYLFTEPAAVGGAAVMSRRSFVTKLGDEMNRAVGEQPVRPLSVMIVGLGALGIGKIALRRRRPDDFDDFGLLPHHPALWPILLAWWGSAALSLGTLLVRDQTVRWDLFLYPAICLGAGPMLAPLWRRGRAGKLVVGVALAFLLLRGLAYWVGLIVDYLHV